MSAVRVVVLRRKRVTWSSERLLTNGETLEETLVGLLKSAPLRHGLRPSISVSVGPSLCIVRRLEGLPPVSTQTLAIAMIGSNMDRFFPLIPETSRLAAAVPAEPGAIWAVTVNNQLLEAVGRACERARVRLRTFAPTCTVLRFAMAEQNVASLLRWTEGEVSIDVEVGVVGQLANVKRHSTPDDIDSQQGIAGPQLCEHLRALGSNASSFADAYGAAVAGPGVLLSFGPAQPVSADGHRGIPRWRTIVAAAASVVGLIAALGAPIVSSAISRMTDHWRLRAIADSAQTAAAAEAAMFHLDASVRAIAEFKHGRTSPTFLLASLTRALPQQTALAAFQFDSSGVSAVAIGRDVMGLLAALDSLQEVAALRATSPITRETSNGIQLQRLSVAFTLRRSTFSDMQPTSDTIASREHQ